MSFFMSADYSLSTKVMEIIYFIIGLLCIYCGVKNLKDKENPEPWAPLSSGPCWASCLPWAAGCPLW